MWRQRRFLCQRVHHAEHARKICPTDAISNMDGKMATDAAKCILCMACIHACPKQARILPPPLQEKTDNMLAAFKAARNKNETFF